MPTAPRPLPAPSLLLPSIPPLPSQRASEIGAHFFFSIYTCDEPPLSNDYHSWLTQIGCEHPHHQALRAAIEAAGMAGSSGIFYAPNVAARAREEYGRAMAATSQALNDPAASILDTTFLTVILLGLVEVRHISVPERPELSCVQFINTENWGHHRPSTAHMEGAIALLQHRGQKKFDRERSVQLFYQLRSHIVCICQSPTDEKLIAFKLYTLTQYDIPFPSALLQLAQSHRPSFLGDMKFRLLNLRGAIKKGPTSDSGFICETARQMDRELDAWGETLTPSMSYEASKSSPDSTYFKGIRHIYKDLWTAQLWNSWRTISIEVNQLIMESGVRGGVLYDNDTSTAACKIRKMSTDICISVPEIMGSPRRSSHTLAKNYRRKPS